MMNKDEAVQRLATVVGFSIAQAEDLYDSFFPKPVVKQYVADWYEENKEDFDYNLWDYLTSWEQQKGDDFKEWINNNNTFQTLVNMHQFGYEVEKETKYRVKIKASGQHLYNDGANILFYLTYKGSFTRKELENANFGWVFDCPGMEVKEVE